MLLLLLLPTPMVRMASVGRATNVECGGMGAP